MAVDATATSAAIENSFAMDLEPALKAGDDGEKSFGQLVNRTTSYEIIFTTIACSKCAWYFWAKTPSEKRRIICYLRSFNLPRPVFLGAIFPTLRPGGVVLPTDDWRPIC